MAHGERTEDPLAHPHSREIYDHINTNPYQNESELGKHFSFSHSTFIWHLDKLRRSKLVRTYRDGAFIRVCCADQSIPDVKPPLKDRILETIVKEPGIAEENLTDAVGLEQTRKSRKLVSYHINTLKEYGKVCVEMEGEVAYCYPRGI